MEAKEEVQISPRWTLVRHERYGFFQVDPTPSPAEINEYYAAEFYSSDYERLNDSSLEVQERDGGFYESQREDVCDRLEELIGPLAGRSLLDIGCGWGRALRYFRSRGLTCAGIDPAPEAVDHAQRDGLDVVLAGVDTLGAFGSRRFDVVTLFNVLEHLADPVGVVCRIRDHVLGSGGIVVIDVPNEFNAFQLAAQATHDLEQWWVAPPAHLNYFSSTTLRNLLEGEGFKVPIMKASFPMEMFLLFGDNYVVDGKLGRRCHERRMAFEANLRAGGGSDVLDRLYRHLAELDLGRQVLAFGQLRQARGR